MYVCNVCTFTLSCLSALMIPFPSSEGTGHTHKIQLLKKIDGKLVLPGSTQPFAQLRLNNGAFRKSSLTSGVSAKHFKYSFASAGLHAAAERRKKKETSFSCSFN